MVGDGWMGAPDPGAVPEDMICFSVYAAAHAFTRAYRPLLQPHGLTYPQYLVLSLLWAGDGRSVGALADPLFLDSGTVTPLLKRLERAGLVRKERGGADERQVLVWLTPEGRALRTRLAGVPAAIGCASGLTAEATREMSRLLLQLGGALRAAEPAEAA